MDIDQKHSAAQLYDRIAGVYDFLADASEHESRDRGLQMLDVREGEIVFELGFGTGQSLVELSTSVGRSGLVVGVDVSSGMARVANKRLRSKNGTDSACLVIGDGKLLPLQTNGFDAAMLSFTLELFEGEELNTVLSELRRVLRPGGRLVAVSLCRPEEDALPVRIYQWIHRHFPHFVDCHPIPLDALLDAAGFEPIGAESTKIWGIPVRVALVRNPAV